MADLDFQSPVSTQDNPLMKSASTALKLTVPETKPTPLNQDPKMKILKIMGIVILVLLFLSVIVPFLKPRNTLPPRVQTPTPSPDPNITPIATQSPSDNQFLGKYKDTFDNIEKEIKSSIEYLPPIFDPKIGL